MPERITNIEKGSAGQWNYTVSGTTPWRIYRDGRLLSTVTSTTFGIQTNDADEPPAIEVLDSTDSFTPVTVANPQYATLQWRGRPEAESYLIQRFDDPTYTDLITIPHDAVRYYSIDTGVIDDQDTGTFAVRVVDSEDVESDVIEFDVFIVRNPDPPSIDISYDEGTTTLTVSAS
jgi:hypothetical protein